MVTSMGGLEVLGFRILAQFGCFACLDVGMGLCQEPRMPSDWEPGLNLKLGSRV